jgi:hypothetical protein
MEEIMRASKRFGLVVAVVGVALAASSVALAGGTLPGTYTTKIASPAQFKGTWTLKLAGSGRYKVIDSGQLLVQGTYTTTASTVTFGHEKGQGACAAAGVYAWKRSGKTLRFTRTSDGASCTGRKGVLAHTFTLSG